PDGAPWRVAVAGDAATIPARAVVLAGDAPGAADLVRELAPRLAALLAPIPYPPVVVAALGFGPAGRERLPRGFGVLIPRPEGFRSLGVLWDSHLFPGRGPKGHLLLRAMLGGATDPGAAALDDEEVVRQVRADLRRLFGVGDEPVFREIVRWPRAIPQYELGHAARVRAVEAELAAFSARSPGLFLAGSFLHGIAFGKAARAGAEAGAQAGAISARLAAARR
ncbi:MAG: protoporphyrinogen oxidase, partial [Planctomycetota bacterium]